VTTITHFVASRGLDAVSDGEPVMVLLHGYGSNDEDLPGLTR
jgi:predicted esterase